MTHRYVRYYKYKLFDVCGQQMQTTFQNTSTKPSHREESNTALMPPDVHMSPITYCGTGFCKKSSHGKREMWSWVQWGGHNSVCTRRDVTLFKSIQTALCCGFAFLTSKWSCCNALLMLHMIVVEFWNCVHQFASVIGNWAPHEQQVVVWGLPDFHAKQKQLILVALGVCVFSCHN